MEGNGSNPSVRANCHTTYNHRFRWWQMTTMDESALSIPLLQNKCNISPIISFSMPIYTVIFYTAYVDKMWSWQNAWKPQKYEFLQICRVWVDRKGQRMNHGSAHSIVQLVTGQRMEAWVDHRSMHSIVQLVTGQRMETWVDHRVGAWSLHFPTGQRTPTYGRRILILQAMHRRIDLLWSTAHAQIQFLSTSHFVWKAVKFGW
jgi:hypothetical protein